LPLNIAGYDLILKNPQSARRAVIYELVKQKGKRQLDLNDISKIASQKNDNNLLCALKSFQKKNKLNWDQLKNLSNIISYTGDHTLYEQVIRAHDPTLNIKNSNNTDFLWFGIGKDTLKSSRKVAIKNVVLFEKIYKKDSLSFDNCMWFHSNIKKYLNHDFIRVPEIYDIKEGDRLSAVYSEYVQIEPIPQNQAVDRIVDLSLYFYNLNLADTMDKNIFIIDYYNSRPHSIVTFCARLFKEAGMPDISDLILSMESKVGSFKRQFAHGDLYKGNMGTNNYVVDWDECGFYPPGYDIARGLSFLCLRDNLNELEKFLKEKCIEEIGKSNFDELLFSCLFFHFIFYSWNELGKDKFRFELYNRLLKW